MGIPEFVLIREIRVKILFVYLAIHNSVMEAEQAAVLVLVC